MAKIRTFIAVEVPWPVRSQAEKMLLSLSQTEANVRWVEAEHMHFTLKFLGDVETRETANICRAMSRATEKLKSFEVQVRGAGAFPKAESPRTVWIGATPTEPFVELHDVLEEELADLNFREEHRRYRPHMTLGRVRRNLAGTDDLAALIAENSDFEAGPMVVDEVVLFRSELTRRGPMYEVLGRAELGKA